MSGNVSTDSVGISDPSSEMKPKSSDLITRIESAERGSRELDREIARLFGWHRVEPRFARNKHGAWIAPEDFIGLHSDGSPILDSLHGTDLHREPPSFSVSLDAALALAERLLPGWPIVIGMNQTPETKPWARIGRPMFGTDVTASTPALALVSAILKAGASQ